MNPLKMRLDRLEKGLQNLIEGGLARLLPGSPLKDRADPREVTARMLAALQAGTARTRDGFLEAPEQLTLLASPPFAAALLANPRITAEWQQRLQQAGVEAGLRFRRPLRLNIQVDPHLQGGEIRILMPGEPASGETQEFHPSPQK
jgi:hypothetical protein